VLDGHLKEKRSGPNCNLTIGTPQMSLCLGVNLSPEDPGHSSVDVQFTADWDRAQEIRFESSCHNWITEQPVQRAEHFIEGRAKQATMSQSRRSLVVLRDRKDSEHTQALTCADAQV